MCELSSVKFNPPAPQSWGNRFFPFGETEKGAMPLLNPLKNTGINVKISRRKIYVIKSKSKIGGGGVSAYT